MDYFVHNGYVGWAYGTPGNPQLISESDAIELMRRSGLSIEHVASEFPPAQFAEEGDALYHLFGGNRFMHYGDIRKCGDVRKTRVEKPLQVQWDEI